MKCTQSRTKIVPFDLEKAKNGAYVVTRDGRSVDIKSFNNGDEDYPITVIIKHLAKNEHDEVATFTEKGVYYNLVEDNRDLFIQELEPEFQLLPFDLEKAKQGFPVITRDGHKLEIIDFDGKTPNYPIEAQNDKGEHYFFTINGKFSFYNPSIENPNDLFMSGLEIEKEETETMNETENTEETKQTENSDEYNQYLEYIGLTKNEVRSHNAGKSDYSKQVIQPWTIWHANPGIHTIDKDIIKRVLRTKEEGNMSPINSRILDYEKIIHDCQERIRQLKTLLMTSLPFKNYKTEDDELIKKQLEYYEQTDL